MSRSHTFGSPYTDLRNPHHPRLQSFPFGIRPSASAYIGDGILRPAKPSLHIRCVQRAALKMSADQQEDYSWTGNDEFDELKDRRDLPPLPLPTLQGTQDLVLVRHGQSTWNQAARIQGSSNVSQLSSKGIAQAEAARDKVPHPQLLPLNLPICSANGGNPTRHGAQPHAFYPMPSAPPCGQPNAFRPMHATVSPHRAARNIS